MTTEKDHSRIGPSSAKRWRACPGSVRLSEGLPNRAGKAAEDGTEVHSQLEAHLKEGTTPSGTTPQDDAVRMFLQYVRSTQYDNWWTEVKLDVPQFLNPPEPMFGHCDFLAYNYADLSMHLVDLKYGLQVVDVEENDQLLYYAMMAWYSPYMRERYIERVRITIVQPRAYHPSGPIRTFEITPAKLHEFSNALLADARKTQAPDAPLVAGEHCMFCPAAPHCPALREKSGEIAQQEFPIVRQDVGDNFGMIDKPPEPAKLPTPILGDIGQQLPILKMWIGAMEEEIERRLLSGEPVDGFALADKKVWRRWKEEKNVAALLVEKYAVDPYDAKLKSPAQVEKLVGKKAMQDLAPFVDRGVPGKKVVRTGDFGAEPSAQEEFPSLLSPGEE